MQWERLMAGLSSFFVGAGVLQVGAILGIAVLMFAGVAASAVGARAALRATEAWTRPTGSRDPRYR